LAVDVALPLEKGNDLLVHGASCRCVEGAVPGVGRTVPIGLFTEGYS
jgi:hypothetical protein